MPTITQEERDFMLHQILDTYGITSAPEMMMLLAAQHAVMAMGLPANHRTAQILRAIADSIEVPIPEASQPDATKAN